MIATTNDILAALFTSGLCLLLGLLLFSPPAPRG